MLRSLRNRLVLSHILPLVIILPLMGLALTYFVETRILLPELTREIDGEAKLIAQLAMDNPNIWQSPYAAQKFLGRVSQFLSARIMLLGEDGTLLASSSPSDRDLLFTVLDFPDLSSLQAGRTMSYSHYSESLQEEVVDVLTPIMGSDQSLIGIVRITHSYTIISNQFQQVRYVISGILLLGMLGGGLAGLFLALTIERPIKKTTDAVNDMARGSLSERLPEEGPEEIRVLARAFNVLAERLQDLEQARRHLLANLVHELARPLGALRSANQAILEGADNDPALRNELLVGMDQEMGRLQRLLQDLTLLHGQVLGTLELDRQMLDVKEWLLPFLRPWQAVAQDKSLDWMVKIQDDIPQVRIDPVRLGQAVGNLIDNAIKYSPPGSAITIRAKVEAGEFWIQICDTGPGISIEDQQKIFDPFFRGHQGRRFPKGMGLGLTITRDVVEAHGGTLSLDSASGKGSCFTIHLPLE